MIHYVKGDATEIVPSGPTLLMHIVNTRGGWGKGFVVAVSKRWPQPEASYRQWFAQKYWDGQPFKLGEIQRVLVEPNLYVVNMIAQEGYGRGNLALHRSDEPNTTPPIRYEALEACLKKVSQLAQDLGAVVVAPKIGSGLAGGDWVRIEALIERTLAEVAVTIYEYL
jgi:O-acetyl-ADP-ribose deacetylase (regulator of RNase III)